MRVIMENVDVIVTDTETGCLYVRSKKHSEVQIAVVFGTDFIRASAAHGEAQVKTDVGSYQSGLMVSKE